MSLAMSPANTAGMIMVTSLRSGGASVASVAVLLVSLFAAPAGASPTRVDELVRAALQLDRNETRGQALYARNCAQCHGADGLGSSKRLIPSLAGQRQAYLIKQLADIAQLERQSGAMHALVSKAEVAEPQEWADLAAYLNGSPPLQVPQTGDGTGVELGEAIFQEQCASCHEEDARGDDDGFVPSLRNQHYSYLLRQMRSLASWHRHNVDEDLVRFLASLEPEEATAVADYLSRLRGPTRDRARLREDGSVGD
jgi:cytochrome c553